MNEQAYNVLTPRERTTSVVFASPHSGRDYPWSFLDRSVLDQLAIRSSEDAFVDLLFRDVPTFGAPFLMANAPRAFIDMNRSADELDPALIEGVRRTSHNPRVTSGLGVVPRVVANGRAIYRGKISQRDAETRIRDFWLPYHRALGDLLDESHGQFGEAILIDCHSMPHEAIETAATRGTPHPQVVLGDRFGAAAAPEVVERIEAAFASAGLRVVHNTPFAGAYTAQHYGRPSRGQHVVQVEIDRSLYMNEKTIAPSPDFAAFKTLLTQVIGEISAIGRAGISVAAE